MVQLLRKKINCHSIERASKGGVGGKAWGTPKHEGFSTYAWGVVF